MLPLPTLLLLAVQTPVATPRPDAKPVRVWLGSASPLFRGAPVRVFVETGSGNLVVLHRRTDGRIEVLFPTEPTERPVVRAGTYEIRGSGNRPAFTVAEPDGAGMILAALSTDPIWFDEFSRTAAWNPDALTPSWTGADAEGALTDIVQRMLGDGAFNYDVVTYTVAPAQLARQPSPQQPYPQMQTPQGDSLSQEAPQEIPPGSCLNCTFIGLQIIEVPLLLSSGAAVQAQGQSQNCRFPDPCGAPQDQVEARIKPIAVLPSSSARPRSVVLPPAAAAPRRRTLNEPPALPTAPVPRSVTLGGAAPEARSALVRRYVRFRPASETAAVPVAASSAAGLAPPAPPSGSGGEVVTTTGGTMVTPYVLHRSVSPTASGMTRAEVSVGTVSRGTAAAPATVATAAPSTVALPLAVWRGSAGGGGGVVGALLRGRAAPVAAPARRR
jgi:hypothetical protein